MNPADLTWLVNAFKTFGVERLIKENVTYATTYTPAQMLSPVECASKLTETDKYYDIWHNFEVDQKQAGLTYFMQLFETWLLAVGSSLPVYHGVVGAANHTVVAASKIVSVDITGPFVFPVYEDTVNYDFTVRRAGWSKCTDNVILLKSAFGAGWPANGNYMTLFPYHL